LNVCIYLATERGRWHTQTHEEEEDWKEEEEEAMDVSSRGWRRREKKVAPHCTERHEQKGLQKKTLAQVPSSFVGCLMLRAKKKKKEEEKKKKVLVDVAGR
jgi:hypothetical protein